jgi:hypothetical protein
VTSGCIDTYLRNIQPGSGVIRLRVTVICFNGYLLRVESYKNFWRKHDFMDGRKGWKRATRWRNRKV